MNTIVKGIIWTSLDKFSLQVINFLVFLMLARLLEPKDFGLVALSSVFVAFFQLFIDQGMAQAIVQFEKIDESYLNTAFWVSNGTGIACAILGWLVSYPMAIFFHEPELQPMVAWLSLSFIFSALSSTQQAILQRNLKFKKLALRSIIAKIISGVVGIGLALSGVGVWSLVAQTLAYSLTEVIMLWSVSDWRPSIGFSLPQMNRLVKFGMNTLGVRLLEFFDFRFDDLVIGYFLGATMLGYYIIAFRLLRLLMDFLASIPAVILFPTLARLQNDLVEFKKSFSVVAKYAVIIIWPVFLGVFVLAEELILTVFGGQWAAAVPVLRLLVLGGAVFCSLQLNGSILWALGHINYVLKTRSFITIIRVIAYLIAVQFGILHVAAAYFFVSLFIFAPLYLNILYKFVNFLPKEILNLYIVPIVASTFMAFVLLAGKALFLDQISNIPIRLITVAFCGFVVYLVVILVFMPDLMQQTKLYLANLRKKSN